MLYCNCWYWKTFDSSSNLFLLVCLKNYGYGNDFIKWFEMLLECQESCIINGYNTTKSRRWCSFCILTYFMSWNYFHLVAEIVECACKYVDEIFQNLQNVSPYYPYLLTVFSFLRVMVKQVKSSSQTSRYQRFNHY